jgi:hypothetical protein
MSLRGTKQSPIVGGDCFGKNALAMTFAKKAERTYLEDYTIAVLNELLTVRLLENILRL